MLVAPRWRVESALPRRVRWAQKKPCNCEEGVGWRSLDVRGEPPPPIRRPDRPRHSRPNSILPSRSPDLRFLASRSAVRSARNPVIFWLSGHSLRATSPTVSTARGPAESLTAASGANPRVYVGGSSDRGVSRSSRKEEVLDVLIGRCAGLDLHRDSVVATVRVPGKSTSTHRREQQTRTFAPRSGSSTSSPTGSRASVRPGRERSRGAASGSPCSTCSSVASCVD